MQRFAVDETTTALTRPGITLAPHPQPDLDGKTTYRRPARIAAPLSHPSIDVPPEQPHPRNPLTVQEDHGSINVKLGRVVTSEQKQQIVKSLAEAIVAIEGENSGASRGRRLSAG